MSIQKKLEKPPHQQSYINILERNNYQFELMDEVGISNKITKAFKELLHLAPVGVNARARYIFLLYNERFK